MVAALNGHVKTVDLLLNAGADPMLKDTSKRSALLLAASNNHFLVVKQLRDAGQNGNQVDSNGNGIWHLMAMSDVDKESGQIKLDLQQKDQDTTAIMKELISLGILLDTFNNEGKTALIIAAKQGKAKIVKNLLELGASTEILTPEGESALTLAEAAGHNEVIKLLR